MYFKLSVNKPLLVYSPGLNIFTNTQRTGNLPALCTTRLLTHITRGDIVLLSLQPTATKALFLLDLEPELHDNFYGQFNLMVLWKQHFQHFKVELLPWNKKKTSKQTKRIILQLKSKRWIVDKRPLRFVIQDTPGLPLLFFIVKTNQIILSKNQWGKINTAKHLNWSRQRQTRKTYLIIQQTIYTF